MTTELLFREDAYLRTATARVLAVSERGIELDRTVFYPQGGGQAGDSGKLLRKVATGGALAGGVVTYARDGRQYVAFTSGNVSPAARTGITPAAISSVMRSPPRPSARQTCAVPSVGCPAKGIS